MSLISINIRLFSHWTLPLHSQGEDRAGRGRGAWFCLVWAKIKPPMKRLPSIFIPLACALENSALGVDRLSLSLSRCWVCICVTALQEASRLMKCIPLHSAPKRRRLHQAVTPFVSSTRVQERARRSTCGHLSFLSL